MGNKDNIALTPIARIETPFGAKFGVPRQAGLVAVEGRVVFEPEYRNPEAVRGLEDFDYIWLVWAFHLNGSGGREWSPTVRPPRLGGNRRMGVFATRSPFRPNGLGLSSVRLKRVAVESSVGPVLYVEGVDMADGTPIYDIKPYVAYADSHPEARSGFAAEAPQGLLKVEYAQGVAATMDGETREGLTAVLAQDPRPRYQHDEERVYGMPYGGWEVRFSVAGEVLTVREIEKK